MTAREVPTLGLGSEQRQMWTQTVMTLAYGVRERRQALGQVAWSDEQTAERRPARVDQALAGEAPRVRGLPNGPPASPSPTARLLSPHRKTISLRGRQRPWQTPRSSTSTGGDAVLRDGRAAGALAGGGLAANRGVAGRGGAAGPG